MEKQLTSSGCPEQAENCSFVHNPDKTSGSVTWHTPPTPSVPRDQADVPPAPVLGLLTVCCLLFIHQLVMEIFGRWHQRHVDRAQMFMVAIELFTWNSLQ